jgi:ABC-type Mn2+/Zn2+ transport system ATPase subunit
MKAKSPEIEIQNLTVKAGKKVILDNISLTVEKGEFLTLLGKNGSGKTTLIKTILGLIKTSGGSIKAAGEELKGPSIRKIRLKTGYVPQYFSSENDFPITAGDVIAMGKNTEKALFMAREMKIENIFSQPFGKLSGGEKQKVLLAMALSREPEILLMDEPNLNLDIRAYRDFLAFVEKLKRRLGLTIIYVTHLTGHIPKSCLRVAVMKEGRIIMDGPKNKILKNRNIEEIIYG